MALPIVLIVDDDPLQLALYKAMLRHLSCTIMTASGGNQALQLLYEVHPVVILLDMVMAAPDGLQVLHRLRADKQFSSLSVILLSVMAKFIEPADALLCEKVLTKPVHQGQLLETVQDCLNR